MIVLFHSYLLLALAASTGPSLLNAQPTGNGNDEKRSAEGLGALFEDIALGASKGYASAELKTIFGSPPTCCEDLQGDCWVLAGKSTGGLPYQVCYIPGDTTLEADDAAAIKCIIDLHYRQSDVCIDIQGSVCANGYPGTLQRGQTSWVYAATLSSDQSWAMQAGADAIVGTGVSIANGNEILFTAVSIVNDLLEVEVGFNDASGKNC